MQRVSKKLFVIAPLVVIGVLTAICCLLYPFQFVSSEGERHEVQLKEHTLTTDTFTLDIISAYNEKRRAWQITANPLKPEPTDEEVFVLEILVTNHLPAPLDLICYVKDIAGYSYSPDYEADRSAFDTGSTFIPKFKPLETIKARMEFYDLPKDDQELWFHCGLCENGLLCIEGKRNDVALRIR